MLAKLPEEAVAALKQGENLIAIYCNNRVANGLIDCGLLVEKDNTQNFTQTAVQKSVDAGYADQLRIYLRTGGLETCVHFTSLYG